MKVYPAIKIYSFPRSGTNYLMSLLAKNLYRGVDVSTHNAGYVGHWSNRSWVEGNPYGKLFGDHLIWDKKRKIANKPVYIYRDGRMVALSLYRSPHFRNINQDISYSQYIRQNLDWYPVLGSKSNPKMTVFEYWKKHLESWEKSNVFMVRYEELVLNATSVIKAIAKHFDMRIPSSIIDTDYVGWFPSRGGLSWKKHVKHISQEDTDYFLSVVGKDFYGVRKGE